MMCTYRVILGQEYPGCPLWIKISNVNPAVLHLFLLKDAFYKAERCTGLQKIFASLSILKAGLSHRKSAPFSVCHMCLCAFAWFV